MVPERSPRFPAARGAAELPRPWSADPLVPGQARSIARFRGRDVQVPEFLGQAAGLAARLPEQCPVLNLCEDRYLFALGFAAAVLRGCVTLLPPDRSPWTWRHLAQHYGALLCLTDGDGAPAGFASCRVDAALLSGAGTGGNPRIPPERPAVIAFTSGSTGQPRPHPKTWGSLCASARLIADALGLTGPASLVATVPPQHMYGLELSILLPFRCGPALDHRKPFFPEDIRDALATVPGPRVLVTTPVHLRALLAAEIDLPPLELIVSATAPLARTAAAAAECRFKAPVKEIYGCTEAGSIASRRTVEGDEWTLFEGVALVQAGAGHCVEAFHLEEPVPLGDILEQRDPRRFVLHGRTADLVNVAGKRTSLGALNHALTEIEGVRDGAFFLPDAECGREARPVAVAVAPGLAAEDILMHLRERLDPVFLPRAVYLVDALPRSEAGKLPRSVLETLVRRLRAGDYSGAAAEAVPE